MRNLIFQYFAQQDVNSDRLSLPKDYAISVGSDYASKSANSISRYAELFNIEYIFRTSGAPYLPHFGIFIPFIEGWCYNYDNICFIDNDVLATTKSENIFNYCFSDKINIKQSNSGPIYTPPFEDIAQWKIKHELNTGVVVFPRAVYNDIITACDKLYDCFLKDDWSHGGKDQEIIYHYAVEHGFHDLHYKFNYMISSYIDTHRADQTFIHYQYILKHRLNEDYDREFILK